MWFWVVATALASIPDAVPTTFEVGSGSVQRLATSIDGRLVAGVVGNGVAILDTDDWTTTTATPCQVTSAAIDAYDATSDLYFVYLGCHDGTVVEYRWEAGALTASTSGGDPRTWSIDEGDVLGVWFDDYALLLYVTAHTSQGTTVVLHTLDPDTEAIDEGSIFPANLPRTGFVEGTLTASYLVVAHGSDDMSLLTLGGGAAPITNTQTFPYNVSDIAPSLRDTVYAVDSSGMILEFLPSGPSFLPLLTGLDSPSTVSASYADGDEWLVVTRSYGLDAYPMVDGTPTETTPTTSLVVAFNAEDALYTRWGYLVVGTQDGKLALVTANPWIDDLQVSPRVVTDGETFDVSFAVTEPVDWEVRRGGSAAGDGTLLASGTASSSGPVTAPITVGSGWAEGSNALYVLVEDQAHDIGHARVDVSVDNPPDAPVLDDASVAFANGALELSFEGLSDEDLDYYDVYITVTEFSGADWPTGGPAFDGTDEIQAPFRIDSAGGERVTYRISPLTNGQTYYIAVRATDTGGKEGPMSNVVQGMPRSTFSASELAGETGGRPSCTTAPGSAGWLGLLGLGALAGLRRRRGLLAAALLAAMGLPRIAQADPEKDMTPQRGDFELRYGTVALVDEDLQGVYGQNGHDILHIEFGPQLFRVVELDFGTGFYQDLAHTTDASGNASGEIAMLTWFPLSLAATGRLHILDEQIVVPFARFGFDYLMWSEEKESSGVRSKIRGAKAGSHYGFGVDILLDPFARSRASFLEAQTGINDTYLVVEWRKTSIEPGKFLFFENSDGLSFSARGVTVGLKLDF